MSSTSARGNYQLQLWALLLGVALLVIKFVAWWYTNSNAILSDALESIINVVAGAFALYSLVIAAQPSDHNHPYGHGKIEFVSAGFEGALIFLAGILIIVKAIYNLQFPQPLGSLDLGVFLTFITGGLNYLMGIFLIKRGRKFESTIMVASGKHLHSDAWSSVGLIVGLLLVWITGWEVLDSIIAMTFAGFIIYTGYGLVRSALAGIMDETDTALVAEIVEHLEEAYKRFAHGTYLVWYPIIKTDGEILAKFHKAMGDLKFEKILHATFDIGKKEDETKMHACGVFIFNAPWQLDEKLNFCLPQILKILKKSEAANFEVNWIKNS